MHWSHNYFTDFNGRKNTNLITNYGILWYQLVTVFNCNIVFTNYLNANFSNSLDCYDSFKFDLATNQWDILIV